MEKEEWKIYRLAEDDKWSALSLQVFYIMFIMMKTLHILYNNVLRGCVKSLKRHALLLIVGIKREAYQERLNLMYWTEQCQDDIFILAFANVCVLVFSQDKGYTVPIDLHVYNYFVLTLATVQHMGWLKHYQPFYQLPSTCYFFRKDFKET